MCVCVCVRACVRARACVHVRVCVYIYVQHIICARACFSVVDRGTMLNRDIKTRACLSSSLGVKQDDLMLRQSIHIQ